MAQVMTDLRKDHRKMVLLLDVLEQQIAPLRNDGEPDYPVMREILNYCISYPDHYHHPKEDKVYRRLIEIGASAGDFLGLSDNESYSFSAEAVNSAMLCRFQRTKLEALLEEFSHMEKMLLSKASHEPAAAQQQMVLLGRKTAKERIASFLLDRSSNAKRRGAPYNPVSLPMNPGGYW